ncbi:universal stress protein UspA [Niastella vici]|uniref:Universal stress protein n=1 Tax=Niastella vici TaxID=1703345 RepID=A0A1V9FP95_9BACT|nr:universal stress protein [Niastella vici]OQP60179.1 universal stress protein UspA [Niastella vici]
MKYKRILIAVDDSAHSMKAARAGFALGHCLKAVIGVLYVVNKSKEVVNPDLGITLESSKSLLLREAENTIDQYIKMFDGIEKVFRFTPEGLPEHVILDIAKEWRADLIVMGTHAKSGLSRILTGSVAEYVIRHAEIPVMVTPQGML